MSERTVLNSLSKIIEQIVNKDISLEERSELVSLKEEELHTLHLNYGIHIRNKYLYNNQVNLQKLTEEYLNVKLSNEEIKEIATDIEYELELMFIQPDDISSYIIKEVWKKLKDVQE